MTITRRAVLTGAGSAASLALLPMARGAGQLSLKLILDWFINPNHAPILIAEKIGAFAKRGLTVEIIEPADPNDPPKLVAAGQADMAITYQPQFQMQVDQGLPLTRIGALIGSPLNMLLALGDGPVKSIADLKGKKIGYSVAGFEDALLSTMLGTAGLALSDVELVNINFALSQSLLAGSVDAVIGAYRNYELNILALQNRPASAFFVEEYGVPMYDELIFVSNADRVKQPGLGRFLDAVQEGVAFITASPDEGWKHFIDGRPQLADNLNKRAFDDTLAKLAKDVRAGDPVRYAGFAEFLKAKGLVRTPMPGETYLARPAD